MPSTDLAASAQPPQQSRAPLAVLGIGSLAVAFALWRAPAAALASAAQTWPPFVLVAGLLLVGVVADDDGLFEASGARLARLPGGGAILFAGLMGLVAIVTVILNLDTAVAFLTPVLIHSARRRRLDERPFLYGAVFMSNAASLLLPGSNLTNLLVLAPRPVPGLVFGAKMLPSWVASVLVTTAVVGLVHRRALAERGDARLDAPPPLRVDLGLVATIGSAVALLVMTHPALPVLTFGVLAAVVRVAQKRLSAQRLVEAIDPPMLAGLFGVAVALGTLARSFPGPAALLAAAGDRWAMAAIAALATVVFNNLPAAVLLSSWAPDYRRALLIGLNLGPNLAITGALSALLWIRIAKQAGAQPSALTYSKIGVVLVPLSIAAALAAAALFAPGPL